MSFVKVEIITSEAKVPELMESFSKIAVTGMTVYQVMGCGVQYGMQEYEAEQKNTPTLLPKQCVMVVVPAEKLQEFLEHVKKELYTGHIGDGKIFLSAIDNLIRIRTGEEGTQALVEGDI